jgi:hypothetical protein
MEGPKANEGELPLPHTSPVRALEPQSLAVCIPMHVASPIPTHPSWRFSFFSLHITTIGTALYSDAIQYHVSWLHLETRLSARGCRIRPYLAIH